MTRRRVHAVSLLILLLIFLPPTRAQTPHERDAASRLIGEVFANGRQLEYVSALSDRIGSRLTGTPNARRAEEWAEGAFDVVGELSCERVQALANGDGDLAFQQITPSGRGLAYGVYDGLRDGLHALMYRGAPRGRHRQLTSVTHLVQLVLILRDLFVGLRRFEDIRRDLGIASNVLTVRLERLVEHDIVERRQYQDTPARFEYVLTEKGHDLFPVIAVLTAYGDRWLAGEAGPPRLELRGADGELRTDDGQR